MYNTQRFTPPTPCVDFLMTPEELRGHRQRGHSVMCSTWCFSHMQSWQLGFYASKNRDFQPQKNEGESPTPTSKTQKSRRKPSTQKLGFVKTCTSLELNVLFYSTGVPLDVLWPAVSLRSILAVNLQHELWEHQIMGGGSLHTTVIPYTKEMVQNSEVFQADWETPCHCHCFLSRSLLDFSFMPDNNGKKRKPISTVLFYISYFKDFLTLRKTTILEKGSQIFQYQPQVVFKKTKL